MSDLSDSSYRRTAWTAVAVLWIVALLNYLDRNVMATMHDSILANIPMTDAQWGMLGTVFLWIYGIFSPLGGYLADKLGRKWIILISLTVWSAVTWLTGHAQTFEQLLAARALMGISEACYLPAALALITDYHRGSTRSLATGLHNSGIYAGAALGGIGGYMAMEFGWRHTFSIFGVIGILYATIVFFLLRDVKQPVAKGEAQSDAIGLVSAMQSLFREKAFLVLLTLNVFVSISNWLIYNWMPLYLKEHFTLNQGAAGVNATVWLQVASFIAILIGGVWADRWSSSNPRGRTYITAIGFAVAAPALFLTGSTSLLVLAIAGLAFYGVGRGFYDANLMPILRQFIDNRYTATGFGLLNFIGNMAAGIMIYVGGVLRDRDVSLGLVFQGAAIGLVVMSLMLFFLRKRPRPDAKPPILPVEP